MLPLRIHGVPWIHWNSGVKRVYLCEFWHDDSGCSCAEGAEAQTLACFGSQNTHLGSTKHFLIHINNHIASVLVLPVLASFNLPWLRCLGAELRDAVSPKWQARMKVPCMSVRDELQELEVFLLQSCFFSEKKKKKCEQYEAMCPELSHDFQVWSQCSFLSLWIFTMWI